MFGTGSSSDSTAYDALSASNGYSALSFVDNVFQNLSLVTEVTTLFGRKGDPDALFIDGFIAMGAQLLGFENVSNSPPIPVVTTSGDQNQFAIKVDSIVVNNFSVPLVSTLPGAAPGTITGLLDSFSVGVVFSNESGLLGQFISQLNITSELNNGLYLIDCNEVINMTVSTGYVRATSSA